MSARAPMKFSYWSRWVVLPMARLLRLLGFRVRFWWTLPYPYHPLIALLLPFVPAAIAGWAALQLFRTGSSPVSWFSFVLAGLLLAIPLSFPILNAIAFAFRVHLLQGFCFLAGMLVLGAEVAKGSRPPVFGLIPAAFFLAFTVQRIGGPQLLARLRADNAAFEPVDVRDRLVHYRSPASKRVRTRDAQKLFEQFGMAWLAVTPTGLRRRGDLLLRPSPEAGDVLRTMLKSGEWQAGVGGLRIDNVKPPVQADAVTISAREGRSCLLAGNLVSITVRDGSHRQRLSAGRVAPIGNWPLLVIAYFFDIFGAGARSNSWHAGFLPQREVSLGDSRAQALVEAAIVQQNPSATVSAEALRAALTLMMPEILRRRKRKAAQQARQAEQAIADLERWLANDPRVLRIRNWTALLGRPEQLSGKGRALCARLTQAKHDCDRQSAEVAASLLAELPFEEFAANEDELLPLLGSRILALEWQLTPELDTSKLPRECPRWGPIAGFGLMSRVPQLWERLGDLGPRADPITRAFIDEVGERPMLVTARNRAAGRRLANKGT